MLRSRYAREWDKWLHWWNDEKVQSLFCCKNNMGLLISSYLHLKNDEKLTFENFQATYLSKGSPQEAKNTFDGLRRLQKRFEDAYNNMRIHNMIGAILCLLDGDNKKKFIQYYFVDDNRDLDRLKIYYKLVFLGMTHDEIIGQDKTKFAEKYDRTYSAISDDFLYSNDLMEYAYCLLLRLNVDQDIDLEREFDFNIWRNNNRSLEHIMPKSKVCHLSQEGDKWFDGNDEETECAECLIKRNDICYYDSDENPIRTTEHSIGNLVLLYRNENSSFNNSDFSTKKKLFFNPTSKKLVKSRHLLHTICVFAEKESWDGPSIVQNKINTIKKFEQDYNELKKQFEYEKQD